jgi:hypothetical protein
MDLCGEHSLPWARTRERGVGKAAFLAAAYGSPRFVRTEDAPCRLCPDRPIVMSQLRLCKAHAGSDTSRPSARLPEHWWHRYEQHGEPVPIDYADERAFGRW